ncbi:hypothetical protein R3398_20475 [Rossellomorea marisflavi]|uniref:hypothetical protein n=1 Tax=Rossellomorea marisflavi TaxID=189381 RepID=UPI00296EC5A7|nr:hypothetical protein [Rossellomorea marisflavi]MDW4528724.1 hypothetical protein [Rossellomorea marisflavi]
MEQFVSPGKVVASAGAFIFGGIAFNLLLHPLGSHEMMGFLLFLVVGAVLYYGLLTLHRINRMITMALLGLIGIGSMVTAVYLLLHPVAH